MSSEVLYRKWRPRTFGDVAGQEHVTRTLRNAVAQGRVAHAYLFAGPRGTGKTSVGRILAKAANCPDPRDGEPCGGCEQCCSFAEGRSLDLIEIDAASNRGIDNIKELRERVGYAPTSGRYRVYLVDEVHMLTEPAFNALLKTLEEPPPHVIFVLATTESHKVPATIASRCQRFDFHRLALAAVVDRLRFISEQEGFAVELEALELMARTATGSLRDAINLLEQGVAQYGPQLTVEQVRATLGLTGDPRTSQLARQALRGDLAQGLATIAAVRDDGLELRQFTRELVAALRGVLIIASGAGETLDITSEERTELEAIAAGTAPETVVRTLRAFGSVDLRSESLGALPLELALAECVFGAAVPAARSPGPRTPTPSPPPHLLPRERESIPPPPAPTSEARAAVRTPSAVPSPGPPESAPAARSVAGPQTGAPPEPAEEPIAGSLVQRVRHRWRDLYETVRRQSPIAGALLNGPWDVGEEGEGVLVFGFRFPAHADRMVNGDSGKNLLALQEGVRALFGADLRVRCEHRPEVQDVKKLGQSGGGHLVREALDLGARIVKER